MVNSIKLFLFLLPLFYFVSCSKDLEPVHPSVSTDEITIPRSMSLWSINPEYIVDSVVLDSLRLDAEFLELVNAHSRSFLDTKIDSLLSLNLTDDDYQQKMVYEIVGYRLLKLKNYLKTHDIPLKEYQKIYVYIKHELNLRESFISTHLAFDNVIIGDPTDYLINANRFVNMVTNDIESIVCYNCGINNTGPLLWEYYTDLLPKYMGDYSSMTIELRQMSKNFEFQITSLPSQGFDTDNFIWGEFFSYFERNCKGRLIYMVHINTCGVFCPPESGGGGTNPPPPCIYCGQTNCSGECKECSHLICPVCKKYISSTRSSSVCDSHIYCENNGNCIEIGLSASKREVDISDVYNIIADITTSNLSNISNVSLEVQTYNSTMWIQLNNDASNNQMGMINKTKSSDGKRYTFERRAITGGRCCIRARVDRGNRYYYSNKVYIIENAPLRASILANNGVKSHFESLWVNTKDFARNSSNNEVKEYGCIVLIDPLTGEYLFDDCEGTPVRVDANFNQANIIHTIYTYNRNPNYFNPIEVAIFHTHPPLTYGDRSFTEFIPSGPSEPDDIHNARTLRIPGFVWCYFASIDINHKINDPNGIVEYGYERREF